MRTIGFEKLLQKSVDRTTLILFKPFSLKKWLFLVLIAYLAGAMGGGNPGGSGSSSSRTKESEAWAQEHPFASEAENTVDGEPLEELPSQMKGEIEGHEERTAFPNAKAKKRANEAEEVWQRIKGALRSPWGITVAVCLGLAVTGIFLVFTWLGARFRFIWFESIVKDDASIKAPFFKYAAQGDSLLGFFVVLACASLSSIGLLAWWGYSAVAATGVTRGVDPGVWAVVGALALPILVFILLLVVLGVLALFIDHFVVSIMALEGCSFRAAWRKFATVLSRNTKDFVLFCLLVFGLSIATSVAVVIVVWILLLIGLLAGGLVFGLLYLLIVSFLKLKMLFVIIAVILGVPLGLTAIVFFMCLPLPVAVFFRCFSLYFLTSLNSGYAPLALEEAGAPPAAPASPTA